MDLEKLVEYLRWYQKKHGSFEEKIGWSGIVTVKIYDQHGNPIEVWRHKNLITDAGKNLVRDALKGSTTDLKIKYVALGSGTTAPAGSQTTLATEQFRKAITLQTAGTTGVVTTTGFIAASEATSFTIGELGWFAGTTATASANTGIMVARVLYSRAKTSLESLEIDRTDTFS